MKHLFTLFLALIATTALWAEDFIVNGIAYTILNANTVEVAPKENGYLGAVSVPSTVTCNGVIFKVTQIGDYAFGESTNLSSITIPNSVTSIGDRAFDYCTSLTCYATIPPSCDWHSFAGVDNFIPIYVPASRIAAYKDARYWNEFTNIQAIP